MEEEEEKKKLIELESRKKSILRLLEESKSKELYHQERAKHLLFWFILYRISLNFYKNLKCNKKEKMKTKGIVHSNR